MFCEVHWVGPDEVGAWHLALLDPRERARCERLPRAADRARRLAAAALLRVVVAGHLDVDPARVPISRRCPRCPRWHGRPTVEGSTLQVSVSHAGDRVAVACASGFAVGVDVEPVRTDLAAAALASAALGPAESADHAAVPAPLRPVALLRTWTRKEAVVKAAGDGLAVPLASVRVTPPAEPPHLLGYAARPDLVSRTRLVDLTPGPGYLAALAAVFPAEAAGARVALADLLVERDAAAMLRRWPVRGPIRSH
ncbi:MAG TPA: 4'-phosphopantetheinyl transferase superfamily protein [Dermatophilaceae bacterium]|nr:4'-phosphopantetheinyl transferase superfamily protein [Dermatophilaceae bacterium]